MFQSCSQGEAESCVSSGAEGLLLLPTQTPDLLGQHTEVITISWRKRELTRGSHLRAVLYALAAITMSQC